MSRIECVCCLQLVSLLTLFVLNAFYTEESLYGKLKERVTSVWSAAHSLSHTHSALTDPSEEPPVPELGKNTVYNKEKCDDIARHVLHAESLPTQCNQFPSAVQYAKTHDKDRTVGAEILS